MGTPGASLNCIRTQRLPDAFRMEQSLEKSGVRKQFKYMEVIYNLTCFPAPGFFLFNAVIL